MARAGSIKIAANCTPVVNNSLFLCVLLILRVPLFFDALRRFGYLVGPERNYQKYWQHINTRPGMHFLFPALNIVFRV
jgi:hypothetical protein